MYTSYILLAYTTAYNTCNFDLPSERSRQSVFEKAYVVQKVPTLLTASLLA